MLKKILSVIMLSVMLLLCSCNEDDGSAGESSANAVSTQSEISNAEISTVSEESSESKIPGMVNGDNKILTYNKSEKSFFDTKTSGIYDDLDKNAIYSKTTAKNGFYHEYVQEIACKGESICLKNSLEAGMYLYNDNTTYYVDPSVKQYCNYTVKPEMPLFEYEKCVAYGTAVFEGINCNFEDFIFGGQCIMRTYFDENDEFFGYDTMNSDGTEIYSYIIIEFSSNIPSECFFELPSDYTLNLWLKENIVDWASTGWDD